MKPALAVLGLLLWLSLAGAVTARAQDSSGTIDTRESVEAQIHELERRVGGDLSAEKQSVIYRWLADLYVSVGRLDDAQRAYEQILVFFPYDVGTANALATFFLDQRRDPAGAEKILNQTVTWAAKMENPPAYLGQTHALRARALRELGRCDDALEAVDQASALLESDAAEEALRVQARCLEALGQREEAQAAYLRLIGVSSGSDAGDASALIALMGGEAGSVEAVRVQEEIASAIAGARREREEALRGEDAELVVLTGEDGVRLEGTLRRGREAGAVLFVPDLGGRRAAFTPYAQLMALDGVTTFTIDPRGHGDSRCDSLPSYAALPQAHREKLPADVATACRYLSETLRVPAGRVVLVAEGGACAVVERAGHEQNIAPALVHLSPVFDSLDRDLASAFEFRRPRPTLLVASDEDAYAMRSLALVTDSYRLPAAETRTLHAAGHGATLLRDPANFALVSNWIRAALDLPH